MAPLGATPSCEWGSADLQRRSDTTAGRSRVGHGTSDLGRKMSHRILAALLACSACALLGPPESRPPAFVGAPGPPRPDGCPVKAFPDAVTAPVDILEIATISAVAPTKEMCWRYLVQHEACRQGGDVLFGAQDGPLTLGQNSPTVWCSARLGLSR